MIWDTVKAFFEAGSKGVREVREANGRFRGNTVESAPGKAWRGGAADDPKLPSNDSTMGFSL